MNATVPSRTAIRDYALKLENFMTNFMVEITNGVSTGMPVIDLFLDGKMLMKKFINIYSSIYV